MLVKFPNTAQHAKGRWCIILLGITTISVLVLSLYLRWQELLQEPLQYLHTVNKTSISIPFQSTRLPDVVVDFPSTKRPFAFFHNRKCGGSTLRASIFKAALRHEMAGEVWVPCHNDHCQNFEHIPRESPKAIYASHINYEDLLRAKRQLNLTRVSSEVNLVHTVLPSKKNVTFYHLDDDRHHFDCLTNLRPTVSRAISCYNYRFKQMGQRAWHMPPASNLNGSDWSVLLPQAYDKYSGGCNNEMARNFGSINDETIINSLTRSSPYFESELHHAAGRMSQCIIVNLDQCEESNTVLRYYLPWLGNALDLCTHRANAGKSNKAHTILRNGSAEAILALNEFDEVMFQFGSKLFEEQLQNARTHFHNQTK